MAWGDLMATHPVGPGAAGPTPRWYPAPYPGSATCNRAYLLAAVRAGLIALVLLMFLIAIAVF